MTTTDDSLRLVPDELLVETHKQVLQQAAAILSSGVEHDPIAIFFAFELEPPAPTGEPGQHRKLAVKLIPSGPAMSSPESKEQFMEILTAYIYSPESLASVGLHAAMGLQPGDLEGPNVGRFVVCVNEGWMTTMSVDNQGTEQERMAQAKKLIKAAAATGVSNMPQRQEALILQIHTTRGTFGSTHLIHKADDGARGLTEIFPLNLGPKLTTWGDLTLNGRPDLDEDQAAQPPRPMTH